jgi:hypothetical protein
MAYEHHAEYEIDRLNRELASLASRSNLMLQQKSGEVARMEAVVGSAEAERARAVAEAKESARAEMEKRLAEAERAADVEARSMRKRIIDLQMALEEEQEQDNVGTAFLIPVTLSHLRQRPTQLCITTHTLCIPLSSFSFQCTVFATPLHPITSRFSFNPVPTHIPTPLSLFSSIFALY